MDKRLPSVHPPAGLSVEQVPLFVTIGFDDNGHSGLVTPELSEGVRWASEFFAALKNPPGKGNSATYDGLKGSCTFYQTAKYIGKIHDEPIELVRKSWRDAHLAGNETGCHTYSHDHGSHFTKEQWRREIDAFFTQVTAPYDETGDTSKGIAISSSEIVGFRTPFLEYNNEVFKAVSEHGFLYDCSIEEGFCEHEDGTNFLWPYTLDEGSPGNLYAVEEDDKDLIGPYPGLWEIPCHVVIVPPDDLCEQYGIKPGFRERMATKQDFFKVEDGKITGLDYNCLCEFEMTKDEWLATLKYTFDLRVKGNRAPFTFGGHSDVYATGYDICPNITIAERRDAIVEFFTYVQQYDFVRIVSVEKIVRWLQNPVALEA